MIDILRNVYNVTALFECLSNVGGNVTLSVLATPNQQSFNIRDDAGEFGNIVTGLNSCLRQFNVSGTTSYIDVLRTTDEENLGWAAQGVELSPLVLGGLSVRTPEWGLANREERLSSNLERSYLSNQNINLRGYDSKGCDGLILWPNDRMTTTLSMGIISIPC